MERLPLELLDAIYKSLTFEDLKTLRQVNKSFAERVTPRVFSSIAIWLQKDSVEMLVQVLKLICNTKGLRLISFNRLAHISQQKHLREHVKHLRVALELFIVTSENYEVTYCSDSSLCDDRMLLHDAGGCDCIQISDDKAAQIVHDQKWLEEPDIGIQLLGHALQNLPSLRWIELSGVLPKYAHSRGRAHTGAALHGTISNYAEWYKDCAQTQFYFLMRAIVAAGENFSLKELSIRDEEAWAPNTQRDHRRHMYSGILNSAFPEYLVVASRALQRVEKLDWAYPMEFIPRIPDQNITLNTLFKAMPHLKDLSLEDASRRRKRFNIWEVFPGVIWHRLHSLRFHKMEVEGGELFEFVAQHSSSLRVFELGSCKIVTPSFKSFLKNFRACLTLESFSLCQNIIVATDRGNFEFPWWRGTLGEQANLQALFKVLNDFVTKKIDIYPDEILRRNMRKSSIRSFDSDADEEFIEDEVEDEDRGA